MTSFNLPVVLGAAGAVPTDPTVIRTQYVAVATGLSPGITTNLPGSLVEDMVSTAVAGGVLMDQARVETINSLTPYGANLFLINQLGAQTGVPQGVGYNANAFVVFSGPPGYVIDPGFVVSDGSNQYIVQQGGVIQSSGQSTGLYVSATQSGSWAIPAGSITTLVTSVPTLSPPLTVTNPSAGTTGGSPETEAEYRAQVLEAQLATSTGATAYVRTQINAYTSSPRLTRIVQVSSGWQIISGGGIDPYQVGYAILTGLFALNNLVGSQMAITGITKANPGVVTTNMAHGLISGDVIQITGVVGMTPVNGVNLTITVLTPTTFSIGVDTTGYPAYVSGGTISPNPRNVSVSLIQYPDTYVIPYVLPLAQPVVVAAVWNTDSPNFVSAVAVAQNGSSAIISYINSIPVGQPINLLEMQNAFQAGISSILPTQYLSRLVFTVIIDGNEVSPLPGTGLVYGDAESYFTCGNGQVTVTQG